MGRDERGTSDKPAKRLYDSVCVNETVQFHPLRSNIWVIIYILRTNLMDTRTPEKRRQIMQANRPSGNQSTELRLIQLFKQNNIKGWRRKYQITGHPDFVFLSARIAVFVDGCFWHGHNCRNLTPKSNKEYWTKKIHLNRLHDREINQKLRQKNWKVIRIWECELKQNKLHKIISDIQRSLSCHMD